MSLITTRYAKDPTAVGTNSLGLFVNGVLVDTPIVEVKVWFRLDLI